MNEYEIATKKVLPHLCKNLNWPVQLISAYGRVPVQIGGSTVWADFAFYISKNQKAVPWLLVEVKQAGTPLEQALPQAESYSLILGSPFFCVSDGDNFDFYMTGDSQGKSVKLKNGCLPPVPSSEYLESGVEYVSFPKEIDNIIDLFFVGLKQEKEFLEDTKRHDEASKQLYEKVFQRIDFLSPQELKDIFKQFKQNEYIMIKPPNENKLFKQIDENFDKVKGVLKFIRDFEGDPVINIDRIMDKNENLYLKGCGIFFISQLLAGAHPNDYVVLEEKVSKALRYLGVTDILVKNDTANGYVYINEICKKLFKDKLENRLKEYEIGLASVHNLLWHYYDCYRTKKKWAWKVTRTCKGI